MRHMLQARDRASAPSQMLSPPPQMSFPVPLCLLRPHSPIVACLPRHTRPLPLQRRAPLEVISLAQTDPRRTHLDIRSQALCQDSRSRIIPPLCPGMRLRRLPLQWRAPLGVISLVRIDPRQTQLDIRPQALCRGSRFRIFLSLRPGSCLHHLPLPFRGSHMQGLPPKCISGLK